MNEKTEVPAKEVHSVNIVDELRRSYLDYAMSVIVGRALPDARDGLKPVHRRILHAMRELGNDWNKPYKKSARVVGDVIGKYHPHGDSAVYETIVRMAQPFSMRQLLIDGQGNFGSIDGDAAAAMRYTEIRMSEFAHELLADLDKETVDFEANYDETETIPSVLPTRAPNLLINGTDGIAVGMATKIPPHNPGETVAAALALLKDPDIDVDALMEHMPGPDFPTGAIINGRAGIVSAYRSGRGQLRVRARVEIIDAENSASGKIVVTELPYQLNKARLVKHIAELVKDKKLEDISGLRDESNKEGVRIVIELRKGAIAEVALNNLYAKTAMQQNFSINMVALRNGVPQQLDLKQVLEIFLEHRRDVVTRRTDYLLRKARERAWLLEGLAVASANIENIVATIRAAQSAAEAKEKLLEQTWAAGELVVGILAEIGDGDASPALYRPQILRSGYGLLQTDDGPGYRLSEAQAQAILELRLQRLTNLEQQKIEEEYKSKISEIKDCLDILSDPDRLRDVITEELREVERDYADARRTEITEAASDFEDIDLVPDEPRVLTLTRGGYMLAQSLEEYRIQRRGGIGLSAANIKEEDLVREIMVVRTHDTLLCFSDSGRLHWLPAYKIPQVKRNARGRPLANLLNLEEGESITALLSVRDYSDDKFVVFATSGGLIKRCKLTLFKRPMRRGIRAINLREGETLIGAALCAEDDDIMLFSNAGKCARFQSKVVRAMGRAAAGVRGMRLGEGQKVVGLIIPRADASLFLLCENGYGKRTAAEEFAVKGRGIQGVIAIRCNSRNGALVEVVSVADGDGLILISDQGTLLRTRAEEARDIGRNALGVRVIELREGEHVVGATKILEEDNAITAQYAREERELERESPIDGDGE